MIKQKESSGNFYENQTINSKNFFVSFSHRNRLKKSMKYIISSLKKGNLLDYGCGPGTFVSEVLKKKYKNIYGYEPFYKNILDVNLPIYSTLDALYSFAPFHTITVFEVFEHVFDSEIENILNNCKQLLHTDGELIISVPIEIGPVLFVKEISRFIRRKQWEYGFLEFIKACFLGIAGERTLKGHIFANHKGFDFRKFIRFVQSLGWNVTILSYGPLPIRCWYGNSQVYLHLKHKQNK